MRYIKTTEKDWEQPPMMLDKDFTGRREPCEPDVELIKRLRNIKYSDFMNLMKKTKDNQDK